MRTWERWPPTAKKHCKTTAAMLSAILFVCPFSFIPGSLCLFVCLFVRSNWDIRLLLPLLLPVCNQSLAPSALPFPLFPLPCIRPPGSIFLSLSSLSFLPVWSVSTLWGYYPLLRLKACVSKASKLELSSAVLNSNKKSYGCWVVEVWLRCQLQVKTEKNEMTTIAMTSFQKNSLLFLLNVNSHLGFLVS